MEQPADSVSVMSAGRRTLTLFFVSPLPLPTTALHFTTLLPRHPVCSRTLRASLLDTNHPTKKLPLRSNRRPAPFPRRPPQAVLTRPASFPPSVQRRPAPMAAPSATVTFSDLDGTLVHYPKEFSSYADIVHTDDSTDRVVIEYKDSKIRRTCIALPSKTGGIGYISERTHDLVKQLRNLPNTRFVIITGARASTYAGRRLLLPTSDFEFFENGGRKLIDGHLDHSWSDQFQQSVGDIPHVADLSPTAEMKEPVERDGKLWDLYRTLKAQHWYLDADDYTTNFRINIKKSEGKTPEQFLNLIRNELDIKTNYGLDSSFNLGKADIYPLKSGKANAAKHILQTLNVEASDAVALFDDDNDIELGKLCGASYLPSVTHESVLKAKEGRPWVIMDRQGFLGTEDALERVIQLRERALAEDRE